MTLQDLINYDVLLKTLEETFDTSIDRNTTHDEIKLRIGQREVIDFIKTLTQEIT